MFVISSFFWPSSLLSFSLFCDGDGVDIQKRKANKKYGAQKWESLQETAYLYIVLIIQYKFGLNFIRALLPCRNSGNQIGGGGGRRRGLNPPPPSQICRSRSSGDLITWNKYLGDCPQDLHAFHMKNPIVLILHLFPVVIFDNLLWDL